MYLYLFTQGDDMEEQWKDVIGFEGMYMVSNFGNVKSIASQGSRLFGKILVPYKDGHCRIQLCRDGIKKRVLVHRLVAIHFISAQPDNCEVNHIDFDPTNNHVSNLEWITHQQNILHSKHRLANFKGTDHIHAKLTDADVIEMRKIYAEGGISHAKLAKQYGICPQQCHRIIRRERWAHI
jgi:hypothetical protein